MTTEAPPANLPLFENDGKIMLTRENLRAFHWWCEEHIRRINATYLSEQSPDYAPPGSKAFRESKEFSDELVKLRDAIRAHQDFRVRLTGLPHY